MGRFSASHRLKEDLTATAYLSLGQVDYTYAPAGSTSRDSPTLNQYGLGFKLQKQISERISASGGYDYSLVDRSMESYGRHILRADVTGRF